jgi:microcystin degradation protein MlrC
MVFPDRARFMAYAARVMRGLIIDDVRRRHSQKRGALFEITSLRTDHAEVWPTRRSWPRIGDAIDELAAVDADLAEIVELKFFCGFSFAEIAACGASRNGPSSATGKRAASTCTARSPKPVRRRKASWRPQPGSVAHCQPIPRRSARPVR